MNSRLRITSIALCLAVMTAMSARATLGCEFSLTVSASPTAARCGGGECAITATAMIGATPVSGDLIEFSVTGGPASKGSISPPDCDVTDANGEADATYVSGSNTGTVTVTAKDTEQSGEPTASCTVTVFEVQISNQSVTRAANGILTATILPSGFTPDNYTWTFTGGNGGIKTTNDPQVNVILVDGTPSTYSVTVKANKGAAYSEASANITVNPRNWGITAQCAPDNEPDWGNFPTPLQNLGEERDRQSNSGNIVLGEDQCQYATVSDPNGPNDGYAYVSSQSLAIDQETVINKYLKEGAEPPDPPGINFHEYNESHELHEGEPEHHTVDANSFLVACKAHEYEGSTTGSGHYKQLREKEESEDGESDPATVAEQIWDYGPGTQMVEFLTNLGLLAVEVSLKAAAAVEPTGNWSGQHCRGVFLWWDEDLWLTDDDLDI